MTFEDFFEKYYNMILSYILKKINNASDAEDLAMQTFLSAYENFDKYDASKANYGTWIFVIANNKLKNYYRDKKIFHEMDDSISTTENFSDEILAAEYIREIRETLYEALTTLNEMQRKIVIYKFFYQKNSTQIADMIGIPSGSVRVQLSRALEKLKKYFQKKGIEWEE